VNAQRNPPNSGPASDQNQDGSQPNQQAGSEGPAFGNMIDFPRFIINTICRSGAFILLV
jgi:hypothetical protein